MPANARVTRLQRTALRQIKRWGGAGYLVRNYIKRDCFVCIIDYKPRDAQLRTEGARNALIAARDLAIPPDREEDLIEFAGETWRIVEPPKGPRTNGVAIFYDCEVMYVGVAEPYGDDGYYGSGGTS